MPITFTEPVGGLLRAQQLLCTTLADCTEFRRICGVGDRDGALSRIYAHGLPQPANKSGYTLAEYVNYRPFAIVATNYPNGYRMRYCAEDTFEDSGSLILDIEVNVPDEQRDIIDVPMAEFEQSIGNILRLRYHDDRFRGLTDLFQRSDTGEYLAGKEPVVEFCVRADIPHIPEFGDFMWCRLNIAWG